MCENADCRRREMEIARLLERLGASTERARAYLDVAGRNGYANRDVRKWLFDHWREFLRGCSTLGTILVSSWLCEMFDSLRANELPCECTLRAPRIVPGALDSIASEPPQ